MLINVALANSQISENCFIYLIDRLWPYTFLYLSQS